MDDWPVIATRLALYIDLGLLFGIPLFGCYALRDGAWRGVIPFGRIILALGAMGVAISLLGFALLTAAMTGTPVTQLDTATLTMLVTETAMGWAFVARITALILAAGCALLLWRRPAAMLAPTIFSGGVALASLAWSGHAAATEGGAGTIHLAADIIHLLAGSAWLGALVMLIALVWPGQSITIPHARIIHRALAGFATIGSLIVATLIITGIVNGFFLVGVDQVTTLGETPYGRLLLTKLLMFGAMLALAAANRFWLTPALKTVLRLGNPGNALPALRRTLAIETSLAILIFALVAWLGTLAPPIVGS